ncbi:hypothetical protein SMALB_4668 [Streptomyces malaysiensis]|uniref:Uncharacterized protein n=1 Tax=Streptomyces malaysiensis TaxID=92644 RepID=A0A7X5X6A5_STRMQ|nr:hypothetical protein [Streptomyces malaysiensis]
MGGGRRWAAAGGVAPADPAADRVADPVTPWRALPAPLAASASPAATVPSAAA